MMSSADVSLAILMLGTVSLAGTVVTDGALLLYRLVSEPPRPRPKMSSRGAGEQKAQGDLPEAFAIAGIYPANLVEFEPAGPQGDAHTRDYLRSHVKVGDIVQIFWDSQVPRERAHIMVTHGTRVIGRVGPEASWFAPSLASADQRQRCTVQDIATDPISGTVTGVTLRVELIARIGSQLSAPAQPAAPRRVPEGPVSLPAVRQGAAA